MQRGWIRISIVVVALATIGFSGLQLQESEQTLAGEQNVERVFTDLSWNLALTLAELRSAQQAYVAAGQDRTYWISTFTTHLETVRQSLDNLGGLVANPETIETLAETSQAIAELEQLDEQAREHTDREQALLASDLIFTDGLALANRAAANIELARATERTTRNEAIQTARASQIRTLVTAVGVGVFAVLLLAPAQPRRQSPSPLASADQDESGALNATSGMLSLSDGLEINPLEDSSPNEINETLGVASELDRGTSLSDTLRAPEDVSTTTIISDHQSQNEPAPDLSTAATLCTDFGCVTSTEQLPELLSRAAALLNASGLIVWVRGGDSSATLRPALEHGYPKGFLTRIGSISEDGNNATAAALRNARMQIVEQSEGAPGALATPLMVANRCIGVLSAELRDGWETSGPVQATATIVAAQLAALLPDQTTAVTSPAAEAHG